MKSRQLRGTKVLSIGLILALAMPVNLVSALNISDTPLDAVAQSAPANIMFLLDDSGSMDWEVMTSESDGKISGNEYVFDNPGDHAYKSGNGNGDVLTMEERKWWKSQWFNYNRMYYNPGVEYKPWPNESDADPNNPRSHPRKSSYTLNMSDPYLFFIDDAVLVDNLNNTAPAAFSVTGTWNESSASIEYDGSSYYSEDVAGRTATWTIPVPTAGSYDVYAYWTLAGSRDTQATYTVNHQTGSTDYVRDQNDDYGKFNLLGTHTFAAGNTTIVLTSSGNGRAAADAVWLVPSSGTGVTIPNAHYYVFSAAENKPYLVTLDGSIKYYEVTFSGTGGTETITALTEDTTPPSDVTVAMTYSEARQNFANWYSFYRRRIHTATAAVANVVDRLAGVQIGFHTLHANDSGRTSPKTPVQKVKVGNDDYADDLMTLLYDNYNPGGGTPLRQGLYDVGQYFHSNAATGGIGDSPYADEADGGACQQAFTIVMTDGYYNGSNPFGSDQNYDGGDGAPFEDSFDNTLADVAMFFYETDLDTTLSNQVPTDDVSGDMQTQQHMVTYGVSFGVNGTLNPDAYDLKNGPYPTWPNPTSSNAAKIDDLYHASVNGRGIFLSASDPEDLITNLVAIMENIQLRTLSSASAAVNGEAFFAQAGPNTVVFRSEYSGDGWTGNVSAHPMIFSTTLGRYTVDFDNPIWQAATELKNRSATSRVIVTYDGSAGKPFRFDDLSSTQKSQLDANWASDDTLAKNLVTYLRGDDTNEVKNGGAFRDRSEKLGDIVHSSPFFHNDVLYVGGNDGMLHAFRSSTGEELFAYVPNLVFSNLKDLADPDYTHKFYVDRTPYVRLNVPITISGVLEYADIMVGGLGKGGKGFYALDITGVTDASSDSESVVAQKILWEFPTSSTAAADIADMGYSYARPYIIKTQDANNPYMVIAGNGYNSPNGNAVLFLLNPEDGTVLKKIDTGVGNDNGMATVTPTDIDGDGVIEYAYVGDLKGNIWKFDMTSSDKADWEVAFEDASGVPQPLFTATGPGGAVQPITGKVDVMYHCKEGLPCGETSSDTDVARGYMVLFGTGRYLELGDVNSTDTQTLYGIWDYGDDSDDREYLGALDRANGNTLTNQPTKVTLLEQTITSEVMAHGNELRTVSDNPAEWKTKDDSTNTEGPDPSSGPTENHAGWFMDLAAGERVDTDAQVMVGVASFLTYTPSPGACELGDTWILYLEACDGSRLPSVFFDVNGDGKIDSEDGKDDSGNDLNASGIKVKDDHLRRDTGVRVGRDNILSIYPKDELLKKNQRYGFSSWQEF